MKLIAHRGYHTNDIKENSWKSFKKAINSNKYVGFELDVRESKDKEFIVYHDLLYEGNLIYKYNYKELNNVLKLEDVLKIKHDKIILIEIKEYKINCKKLVGLLNKYSYLNIYVFSFHNNLIDKILNYNHSFKLGILNYELNSKDNFKYDFIAYINKLLTKEKIEFCNRYNIMAFAYAIRKKFDLKYNNIYYIIDDDVLSK